MDSFRKVIKFIFKPDHKETENFNNATFITGEVRANLYFILARVRVELSHNVILER